MYVHILMLITSVGRLVSQNLYLVTSHEKSCGRCISGWVEWVRLTGTHCYHHIKHDIITYLMYGNRYSEITTFVFVFEGSLVVQAPRS